MKKIILSLLISAFTFPAFADPKLYQVEVLVFQNAASRSELKEALSNSDAHPKFPRSEIPSPTNAHFQLVEPAQLRLVNEHRRLQQSNRYKVLLHLGWFQTISPENAAIASHVFSRAPQTNNEMGRLDDYIDETMLIDGVVSLSQGKKIRTKLDFVMNTANVSLRLNQQALLNPNELYYFDHPLYGVLVKIVPA